MQPGTHTKERGSATIAADPAWLVADCQQRRSCHGLTHDTVLSMHGPEHAKACPALIPGPDRALWHTPPLRPGKMSQAHDRRKAGDGIRTHDNHVGNVVLYQLSYTRSCMSSIPNTSRNLHGLSDPDTTVQ